jgi:hypothetical protein
MDHDSRFRCCHDATPAGVSEMEEEEASLAKLA